MTEEMQRQLHEQARSLIEDYKKKNPGFTDRVKSGYSEAEAEREIELIRRSPETYFCSETGDGLSLITRTKEEEIEMIRRNITR